MNTKGQEVQNVRIVCRGRLESEGSVWVNGVEAGTFRPAAADAEEIHMIEIPQELRKEGELTVSIKSAEGKGTPRIYEVRIVR